MTTNPPVFDDCLTAQLQFMGKIQTHGALLIADQNDVIIAASSNLTEWLGLATNDVLGRPWMALFPELHPPSSLADFPLHGVSGVHLHTVTINGQRLVMARHRARNHVIIEFESPSDTELISSDRGAILAACFSQLSRVETEQQAAESLLHFIALVTGYDRVMLLQFMPDWHGKVTAQITKPGIQGYLHQHFPANDIPENARMLYRKKLQRLIADAQATTADILSTRSDPVDLTFAELRAVHPAHIQYMHNMGIRSAFSVSIIVGGDLWGLVTCHSLEPKGLSFADRQLCEHLASATGLHMSGLKRLGRANERHEHLLMRRQLKQDILANGVTTGLIQRQMAEARRVFEADGAWVSYQHEHHTDGDVPSAASRRALLDWLVSQQTSPIFSCNQIAGALSASPDLVKLASGVLYIEVSDQDFIVLFRKVISETIEWAGSPAEKAGTDAKAGLSPRTSFAAWVEQTRGQATPWSQVDLEAADQLRKIMLELTAYIALEHQTLTDPLTGLGNRNMLNRALDQSMGADAMAGAQVGMLLIDIDHFKPVNDKYGHATGDKVLVELAHRMKALLREADVLVRLGGDEFAIVMPNIKRPEDTETLGHRLLNALTAPLTLDNGASIRLTASIGAAVYPLHAKDAKALMHHADMAMYAVKHESRNGFKLSTALA